MVKAFIVTFKRVSTQYSIGSSSGTYSYPPNYPDNRCTVVIANNITEVGFNYPLAISIQEFDAKEVVILNKKICPRDD